MKTTSLIRYSMYYNMMQCLFYNIHENKKLLKVMLLNQKSQPSLVLLIKKRMTDPLLAPSTLQLFE